MPIINHGKTYYYVSEITRNLSKKQRKRIEKFFDCNCAGCVAHPYSGCGFVSDGVRTGFAKDMASGKYDETANCPYRGSGTIVMDKGGLRKIDLRTGKTEKWLVEG